MIPNKYIRTGKRVAAQAIDIALVGTNYIVISHDVSHSANTFKVDILLVTDFVQHYV
jgi:hypothetical protein